jgi:hypothetical protein
MAHKFVPHRKEIRLNLVGPNILFFEYFGLKNIGDSMIS